MCQLIFILRSNFHVLTLDPRPEYNIIFEVLFGFHIFLKICLVEIKFLIILPNIIFALDTIDKIWLSALNVASKPTSRLHSSSFFIFMLLYLYSTLLFWGPVYGILYFPLLNLNFLICQFVLLFFYNGLTRSLTSSTNRVISDFKSFARWFMDIKNKKGSSTDLWGAPKFQNICYLHSSLCKKIVMSTFFFQKYLGFSFLQLNDDEIAN